MTQQTTTGQTRAPEKGTSRRGFLRIALLAAGGSLLAACQQAAAPSPTTAPAKPAAAPTTAPAAAPKAAASPSAAIAAKPSPAAAGQVSDALKPIIEAANREGQLQLYWTSTATDQWRQRFQDAVNQKYGTKLTITDTRGNDWERDTAKLVGEVMAGQKPAWDMMITTEAHHNGLRRAELLGQHKWVELFGVPQQAVMFGGGSYAFAHQVALPAYNRDLVKGDDIPKKWDDLLNPRWKDKIGVTAATHHFARLSQSWGDDKTTQFVQQLAALNPRLGPPADLNQRVQLGELHVLSTQVDNFIRVARRTGAPVVWAEQVQPILLQSIMAGPVKGGPNPNAAILFCGFLGTPEGRELWQEFQEQGSIFIQGTPYQTFVQGKEYIILREDFMEKELDERTAKYGRLIGYR